jgi:hypothetical protein
MEAVIKQWNGLSFSTFVSLFWADKDLNLLGKQAANRSIPPGGKDFSLTERRFTQTDRDILSMGIS